MSLSPGDLLTVEFHENGDSSPSPSPSETQPTETSEQFCTLCGNVASSDGSLPDGTTVASKLSVWQSFGHVSNHREIPEGAPLCQSCVDLVVSTLDLDDNLDNNFELLWGLLRADNDDDDILFEGVHEDGEFDSNWRKNLAGQPLASKYRQNVLFPKQKKYLKQCRYKIRFGEQNKGPSVEHDQCVVCKGVERAVANAATCHFPGSGKLVIEKMQSWCKARQPEPCRPLRRPTVPLCQLCVDMLLDTEDIETKILENLAVLSRLVKENPKMSHVAVGRSDQLLEDLDVKPQVLPSILVRTEMDGEDGPDLVDVKPDIDILQNRLENISQQKLADVKLEYEGLAAPLPEGSDPLAPGNGSAPFVFEEEEKPVFTRSGRAVRKSAAAKQSQSLSLLAQFSDSDDSDVEIVHAKVKSEKVNGDAVPSRFKKKSKPFVEKEEEDDEWYISGDEKGGASGEDDLDESDDPEEDYDEPDEGMIAIEMEQLRKSAPVEQTVAERVAGSTLWFSCKCRACGKELANDVALDFHFKEEHPGLQPYACHFCLLEFKKGDDFVQHVMIEELKKEAEGEFKCKHCDENFPNPRFISCHHGDNHMCEDTEGGLFKCKECSLPFTAFMQFVEHRQKPLKEHTDAAPNHRPEFKCRLCGCESETEESYGEHLQAMHSQTAKLFECPRCNCWFPSMKLLAEHFYSAEFNAKRECEHCNLRFPNVALAKQHRKANHPAQPWIGAEKMGICPHCGVGFKELDRHISVVHRKEKREKCHICGEKFSYQHAKARHLALVHKVNVKAIRHECSECGKIFTNSGALRKHLLGVHGILKAGNSYDCTLCDRRFVDARTLKEHTYSHEGIKPHQCPHCDHRTVTFVNLKTHLKWRHRRICSRKFHEDAVPGDDLAYDIVDEGPWIREETGKAPRRSKKNEEEGGEPKKKRPTGRKRSKKTKQVEEEEDEDTDEEEAFSLGDEEEEEVPKKKRKPRSKKKASNEEEAGEDGVEPPIGENEKEKAPNRKTREEKASNEEEENGKDDSWDEEPKKVTRKRVRPRKVPQPEEKSEDGTNSLDEEPKNVIRKRGRPRKYPRAEVNGKDGTNSLDEEPKKTTRKRGRPRKVPQDEENVDLGDFDESLFDEAENEGGNEKQAGARASGEEQE